MNNRDKLLKNCNWILEFHTDETVRHVATVLKSLLMEGDAILFADGERWRAKGGSVVELMMERIRLIQRHNLDERIDDPYIY